MWEYLFTRRRTYRLEHRGSETGVGGKQVETKCGLVEVTLVVRETGYITSSTVCEGPK